MAIFWKLTLQISNPNILIEVFSLLLLLLLSCLNIVPILELYLDKIEIFKDNKG